MPNIGSSISQAANVVNETVIAPTKDTLQTAVKEGIVEPVLGTNSSAQSATPTDNTKPAQPSDYTPQKRQNVVNFLNSLAEQDKKSRAKQEAISSNKQQEEEEIKKQTEIRQIEIKQAKRNQMINQSVYDKQRNREIKKGV